MGKWLIQQNRGRSGHLRQPACALRGLHKGTTKSRTRKYRRKFIVAITNYVSFPTPCCCFRARWAYPLGRMFMSGGGAELRFPEERLSQGGHGHTRSNVMARVGNWQPPRKAVAPYFAGWTVLCKTLLCATASGAEIPPPLQFPLSLINSQFPGSARSGPRARSEAKPYP